MPANMLLGIVLSLALLVALGLAVIVSWKSPFRALGILVAGMAVHNLLLMVLIRADTPALLIRGVQAWKEILLAVLLACAAAALVRGRRRPNLTLIDWIAVAFTALVLAYFVIQLALGGSDASLGQRLVSLRLSLLMPLLYLFGRCFVPHTAGDLGFTRGAIMASAAAVGLFGLWELWFVPTQHWIEWGAVGFSRWLGFDYHGPQGLPANFFQTTESGLLLRRMVSTYLSPLGIAYTGLLVAPFATLHVLSPRPEAPTWPRWLAWTVLALVLAGVAFSVTRVALACLVAELVLVALLLRSRRVGLLAVAVLGIALLIVFPYPSVGPLMTSSLAEVASPTRVLRDPSATGAPSPEPCAAPPSPHCDGSSGGVGTVLSGVDPSIRAHIGAIAFGVGYIVTHPLGTGPGSAVPRYGSMQGPAESALLRIGGELGLPGALLYVGLYGGVLVAALIVFRRDRGWQRSVGLATFVGGIGLIPVSLTSDVWGNFSVTFLFWWLAGLSVHLASARSGADRAVVPAA